MATGQEAAGVMSADAGPHHPAGGPSVPSEVMEFLHSFVSCAMNRDAAGLRRLYEVDFNTLTDTFYSASRWPAPDVVDNIMGFSKSDFMLLLCLYKELYYRHLHAKCGSQVEHHDRIESWKNYDLLTSYFFREECIITPDKSLQGLQLPSEWAWDMLDEYVYQMWEAQNWRMRNGYAPIGNPPEEGAAEPQCWSSAAVLQTLTGLVRQSSIIEHLKTHPDPQQLHLQGTPLKYQLGYFSMISLLRVNVLLGDYRAALHSISPLRLSEDSFFWRVPACTVTLYYLVGFSYLMLRRCHDALRVLSQILVFVSKSQGFMLSQSYQRDAMMKMADRMLLLAMAAAALAPARLDDSVALQLRDQHPDKYFKIQSEDEDTFRDIFMKCCPKFINPFCGPVPPMHDPPSPDEPRTRQLELFLQEVHFQKKVNAVQSFAKLYNNISISKLTSLMDVAPSGGQPQATADAVRAQVLCVKSKSHRLKWGDSGDFLSGAVSRSTASVDFYLDLDLIHVQNSSPQRVYTDFFQDQIRKTQEMMTTLQQSAATVVERPPPQPLTPPVPSNGTADMWFGARGGVQAERV